MINYHAKINPFFSKRKDAHLNYESYLKELINTKETKIFIALEDKKLIGYIVVKQLKYPPIYLFENFGYIEDIVVSSNYRRKGVGQILLEEAFKWFRSRKLKRVELNVAKENKKAYSFYLKNGFKDYKHRLFLDVS